MSTESDKPTVLIVGGGLGGLMLGALLEKSNVPYTIFERAATVKPLGGGMTIGPTLLPVFEQLGIYDELVSIGKYLTHTFGHKETLEPYKPTDFRPIEEYTGYVQYLVARPMLYDLLLRQVPAHKIHFGKRVLKISEEDNKVSVHLADNSSYEGDIIVGADGAYSAVRQRMYEQLKNKDKLPKSDQEDLPFSCTCLVGQTKVLNPEDYPIVKEELCQFLIVLGEKKPFTWSLLSTSQNTITWTVIHHLSKTTSQAAMEQRFRCNDNSEWGAIPAQAMCDETRDFPIPLGQGKNTMGDIYALTPKEQISKVMLEEKVFETWYSGRTVLLGDACHKLHPAGGHGAVTAMHDAIALANLIYAMPMRTSEEVTQVFEEYRSERLPAVMDSFNMSKQMSMIAEKGIVGAIVLYLVNHIPFWLWKLSLIKMIRFRPQIGYLPSIPPKGTVVPIVSPSELKARAVYEKNRRAAASL